MPTCQSLITSLLKDAIRIGIKEREFWDMTVAEIQREADGITERKRENLVYEAQFVHALPQLIALSVARLLDKNAGEYPPIEEVFGELFPKEQKVELETKRQNELNIARFLQFANLHNKQISEVK